MLDKNHAEKLPKFQIKAKISKVIFVKIECLFLVFYVLITYKEFKNSKFTSIKFEFANILVSLLFPCFFLANSSVIGNKKLNLLIFWRAAKNSLQMLNSPKSKRLAQISSEFIF